MKNIILGFLVCYVFIGQAQNYATGLVFDEVAYGEVPLLVQFTKGSYPSKYSLKEFAPIPKNQHPLLSCVGWATGYAALTIEQAIADNNKDKTTITANAHSALYIYNQITGDCKSGTKFPDALELLKTKGDCLLKSFEKNKLADCSLGATTEHNLEAAQHKVVAYDKIIEETYSIEKKIDAVKRELANNHPVIVGMKLTQSFGMIDTMNYWKWIPSLDPIPAGGHAMCVVAYDDKEGCFELMNSWGKDWGKGNGFVKVMYNDFAKYCKEAYVLTLSIKKEEKRELEASFALQYPESFDANDNVIYQEAKVALSASNSLEEYPSYRTTGSWSVEDQYRFIAEKVTKGTYVYMFSLDTKKNLALHFPSEIDCVKEWNNCNSFGSKTTTKIKPRNSNKNDLLIIPGAESVLELEYKGIDYACILYSTSAIPEAELCCMLKSLKNSKDSFDDALKNAFGDLLVPANNIKYKKNKMDFEASCSKGQIVPVVLEINVD
ncbi:MAG: C1 family peptidase [Aureispira sp.]|nr:C1 family peptidase [Aureispira sp.]